MKRFFAIFCLLALAGADADTARGQQDAGLDSVLRQYAPYFTTLRAFSDNIPHEKVYLHFDNTSYAEGDDIWFAAYVTNSANNRPGTLSKTLYVELLNPSGDVVARRVVRIEDGRGRGDFQLNHMPFYSGFYEVRAYTKYMLNFGEEAIFSRVLPVYDRPRNAGRAGEGDNGSERTMTSYGVTAANRTMRRPRPVRESGAVNVRFFPEGSSLVAGVPGRIAFEAVDRAGNPIEITGTAPNGEAFASEHEGRGVFRHTPQMSDNGEVEVEHEGRKYRFRLPEVRPTGVTMEVDNLADADSIAITLRKNAATPSATFGIAVLSGGRMQNFIFARIDRDELAFKTSRRRLTAGVTRIVLFDTRGAIVCDRLVFADVPPGGSLDIAAALDKPSYAPYEAITVDFALTENSLPAPGVTFSAAVRDGADAVEFHGNIAAELLLTSEIKGYVRNPAYYFDRANPNRLVALDNLLMVQGWRRYSWERMVSREPVEMRYAPEQAIDTRGRVLSTNRVNGEETPREGVDVSLMLTKIDPTAPEESAQIAGEAVIESFVTDAEGRFSFSSDIDGRWSMILSAEENRVRKNYQIMLDRPTGPAPRRYNYTDLQVTFAPDDYANEFDEPGDLAPPVYIDSIATVAGTGTGVDKINVMEQVTVRARGNNEQRIRRNRSSSAAYYDMRTELDELYDSGEYLIADIHRMLMAKDPDFNIKTIISMPPEKMPEFSKNIFRGPTTLQNVAGPTAEQDNEALWEYLFYKGKPTLVVVDYERVKWNTTDYFAYKQLPSEMVKSVYINERTQLMVEYLEVPLPLRFNEIGSFGAIVFIETYPEGEINVGGGKGTRKTYLEGYSTVSEFYAPDYSAAPPAAPDYRRTLYWNPAVVTDSNGRARLRFHNNGRARRPTVSAETVTASGRIGAYSR